MRRFVALRRGLEDAGRTADRVAALRAYFATAPPADAAWATYLLSGRRLRRAAAPAELVRWARAGSGLPDWLFDETRAAVGDFAEAIALVLAGGDGDGTDDDDADLDTWIRGRLLPLRDLETAERARRIAGWWARHDRETVLALNGLITGGLPVGVGRGVLARALAGHLGLDRDVVTRRLEADLEPTPAGFAALAAPADENAVRPVPFCAPTPVEGDGPRVAAGLGDRGAWLAEPAWDGVRVQAVRRGRETLLWSAGETLVSAAYPDLVASLARLPAGTVLDGVITGPFATLERRQARRRADAAFAAAHPVVYRAVDLLADAGGDRRDDPLARRRRDLARLLGTDATTGRVVPSPALDAPTWADLDAARRDARARGEQGIVLKRLDAPYRPDECGWWWWPAEPLALDLVLTAAAPARGRRANLLGAYTLGAWRDAHGGPLVTVARIEVEVAERTVRELDRWIRRHTRERYGRVRGVEPAQVLRIAFDAAHRAAARQSGVILRRPRLLLWMPDLAPADAATLADVEALLPPEPAPRPDEGLLPGFG